MNMVLELVLAISSQNVDIKQIINNAKEGIVLQNKSLLTKNIEDEDF